MFIFCSFLFYIQQVSRDFLFTIFLVHIHLVFFFLLQVEFNKMNKYLGNDNVDNHPIPLPKYDFNGTFF